MSKTHLGRSMKTRCSECHSSFRITDEQLDKARGRVICGQCGATFNAVLQLQSDDAADDIHAQSGDPSGLKAPRGADQETAQPEAVAIQEDQPEPIDAADWSLQSALHASQERQASTTATRLQWWGLAFLIVALLLQSAIYFRQPLLENPRFRSVVTQACEPLGCELAELRALELIQLSDRNVYSHPNRNDALMVSASLRNQARFSQHWPDMLLRMSDLRGQIIAERRFSADEYLGQTPKTVKMPSDQPYSILLEVVDPGNNALNYEFQLLQAAL